MSLVCTVTSTPAPKVSWWYRGLFINNGSTMVSDIGECQGQPHGSESITDTFGQTSAELTALYL